MTIARAFVKARTPWDVFGGAIAIQPGSAIWTSPSHPKSPSERHDNPVRCPSSLPTSGYAQPTSNRYDRVMSSESPSTSIGTPPDAPRPVVVVAGLIASGKSTVSRALAEALGATRFEADRVKNTLLQGLDAGEAGTEARWRRDFSPGFEREVYDDMLRRGDEALARGEAVVLDACFPLRAERLAARALAAKHGRPFLFVFCRISDATRHARLAARDREAGAPGWEALHDRLAKHYEPLTELPDRDRIEVSSDGPVEPLVAEIVTRLAEASARLAESAPSPATPPPKTIPIEPRPRIVSFDCWGTLISEEDWHWAHTLRITALRQAALELGEDVPLEEAKRAFEAAWQRHQDLWHAHETSGAKEIAAWGLAELGLEPNDAARTNLVRRFEGASHTGHVQALEGARALLAALARKDTPSVLVCDTGLTPGRVVRRLLDGQGLLEYLAVQIFSDEVGAPKPDPRPFLAAIAPFDVEPSQVVHVGDLRRTDVAGARALGMQTVRIRARHDDQSELPEADHVVDSHAELATLLGVELAPDSANP